MLCDYDDGMRIARADFTFDTWIKEPKEKTGLRRENKREKKM